MLKIYVVVKMMKDAFVDKISNDNSGELGMGTLISIAVAIIVAAFVMIPGLRSFGSNVLASMNDWWTNTVQGDIFPTS